MAIDASPTAASPTGQSPICGPQFDDATPVPRALLDRFICDSEINRVIFGPASEILDVGRSRGTSTHHLRAAIIARDEHCRYPGCTAPPVLCEGHHPQPWARDHGATSTDNGILLCRHHRDLTRRRDTTIARHRNRWLFVDRRGSQITSDSEVRTPRAPRAGERAR
ncbi:HNH endonuclease signature motif containing protein [uncultured Cellulomonas sp.]|uniref:HNH endonuclease signature motif containing protein n=1 Tax=uncultured Cellulomonas sp. TaxID=189682 RepID=UPI002614ADB4|nr:HNH endonuclease signature motif containing protein [uncultured Cellulomonas sp.]